MLSLESVSKRNPTIIAFAARVPPEREHHRRGSMHLKGPVAAVRPPRVHLT